MRTEDCMKRVLSYPIETTDLKILNQTLDRKRNRNYMEETNVGVFIYR